MGSENLSSVTGKTDRFEEKAAQKISVNGSDSFVVDIERFANADKDENSSSRITLQRNLSRKGSQQQRGAEKKQNLVTSNEKDHHSLAISPRSSLLQCGGTGTPEKPTMVVVVGATDHHPQVHNPITIVTGAAIGAKSKGGATTIMSRGFSFKRSSAPSIDPRKILLFFATISSIGTIILICCTLSMNKLDGNETGLN